MTENAKTEALLSHTFTGQLTVEQHQHDVTGTLTVARDGTITIAFEPLTITETTTWLLDAIPSRTRTARWTALRATTSDGHAITTDHLTLYGNNTSTSADGSPTIAFTGQASKLTIQHAPPPANSTGCVLLYHTIGMRGFGRQHATTVSGELYLLGQATIENYDDIAGRGHLIAPPDRPLTDWIETADDTLRHLLKIVSLAEGKPLTWSIRELYANEHLVQIDLYGAQHTGTPRDSTFHYLDLQPVVTLAGTNYTHDVRDQTGIDLAIELFLTHPAHVELQLITAMTALEHLVSVYDKHHPAAPPLPPTTFATLKAALLHAYDEAATALQPNEDLQRHLQRVRDRIGNLNHVTFKDRLWPMLTAYNVPLVGIEDRINKAINVRNDIIHTGMHDAPFAGFYLHVVVLRELLKRIFLTLLNYTGNYESYLNGPEWIAFPPTDTTIEE